MAGVIFSGVEIYPGPKVVAWDRDISCVIIVSPIQRSGVLVGWLACGQVHETLESAISAAIQEAEWIDPPLEGRPMYYRRLYSGTVREAAKVARRILRAKCGIDLNARSRA